MIPKNGRTPSSGWVLDAVNAVHNVIEMFTGAVKQIDSDHAYVHSKKMFSAFAKVAILAGQDAEFSFKTPPLSAGAIHYRQASIVPSADKVTTEIYEGATLSGTPGGTAVVPACRNRISPPVSLVTMLLNPTFATPGTLVPALGSWLPGSTGVGQARVGTEGGTNSEIVLAPDTVYRFVALNESSATNTIGFNFRWYEEPSNGGY